MGGQPVRVGVRVRVGWVLDREEIDFCKVMPGHIRERHMHVTLLEVMVTPSNQMGSRKSNMNLEHFNHAFQKSDCHSDFHCGRL